MTHLIDSNKTLSDYFNKKSITCRDDHLEFKVGETKEFDFDFDDDFFCDYFKMIFLELGFFCIKKGDRNIFIFLDSKKYCFIIAEPVSDNNNNIKIYKHEIYCIHNDDKKQMYRKLSSKFFMVKLPNRYLCYIESSSVEFKPMFLIFDMFAYFKFKEIYLKDEEGNKITEYKFINGYYLREVVLFYCLRKNKRVLLYCNDDFEENGISFHNVFSMPLTRRVGTKQILYKISHIYFDEENLKFSNVILCFCNEGNNEPTIVHQERHQFGFICMVIEYSPLFTISGETYSTTNNRFTFSLEQENGDKVDFGISEEYPDYYICYRLSKKKQ